MDNKKINTKKKDIALVDNISIDKTMIDTIIENKNRGNLKGESFSSAQAKRITLVENCLTFGYVKLKPNMKLTLSELTGSAGEFHVVSGLGLLKSNDSIKLLSRGLTISVNKQNMQQVLETFEDEELTLVWWDDVAEEDWFHHHLF